MPPKTQARLVAEDVCSKFPSASTLQLSRKLRTENPELFSSVEKARNVIRIVRGTFGDKHRKENKNIIPKVPLSCPPSLAEPWVPYKVENCKRVGIISDVHIPYHSELAFQASIDYLKNLNIDTLIINGDFADFYQVSRWQKDPRKRRLSEERNLVISGLAWLRETFSKATIIYKEGNHEERWQHFVWNRAPEIYDLPACLLPNLLDFDKFKIIHITDQRPVLVGKLPVLHGHEMGQGGISSPVNPARGVFLRTNHTILVGHGHRTSTHVEKDMFDHEVAVWSTGCLCANNPEYRRVGKQNWGFAYVEVSKDGTFGVHNLRIDKQGVVRSS